MRHIFDGTESKLLRLNFVRIERGRGELTHQKMWMDHLNLYLNKCWEILIG